MPRNWKAILAESTPADDVVGELATSIRRTLRDWGAGKRKAPDLQSDGEFASALREPGIHALLAALAAVPLAELTVVQERRYLSGKPASHVALAAFDSNLLSVLRD